MYLNRGAVSRVLDTRNRPLVLLCCADAADGRETLLLFEQLPEKSVARRGRAFLHFDE